MKVLNGKKDVADTKAQRRKKQQQAGTKCKTELKAREVLKEKNKLHHYGEIDLEAPGIYGTKE